MDNIRVWMASIRLGWRWENNALVFKMSWRLEERTDRMSGLEKTIQVMKGIMNSICTFLKLPTLDLIIWVRKEDNKTMYSFYLKPIASSKIIQNDCSMP